MSVWDPRPVNTQEGTVSGSLKETVQLSWQQVRRLDWRSVTGLSFLMEWSDSKTEVREYIKYLGPRV